LIAQRREDCQADLSRRGFAFLQREITPDDTCDQSLVGPERSVTGNVGRGR
jgi:hypothetical protein